MGDSFSSIDLDWEELHRRSKICLEEKKHPVPTSTETPCPHCGGKLKVYEDGILVGVKDVPEAS